jgi:long-chain fatty acid transport protein
MMTRQITAAPLVLSAALAAPLAVAIPSSALAGAFQIREGSAAAQGASFAGRSSGDRDVSFALHNPAAFRTVERFEVAAGAAGIVATGDAEADGPAVPGFTLSDDPNEIALVPSFAAGWRYSEHVVFGLAVDAPFGLATKYDEDFIGSFNGIDSELVNITVTPVVSVEPVPDLALAAGVTLSYADARLTNRTGSGLEGAVEGDDFALGFTVGALIDVTPRTTVGAAFSWGISHELEGDISGTYVVAPPPVPPLDGPGSANLDLPAVFSLGVTHGFTEDFRMMAEFEYVGWSSFEAINITSDRAGVTVSEEQNYDNSVFIALGAEYDVTPDLTLRGGVAWDQTPTIDADRSVRTPDADRIWLSVGASWQATESIGVDVAYSYLDFMDTDVALTRAPGPAGRTASYDDSAAHIFALNARYKW